MFRRGGAALLEGDVPVLDARGAAVERRSPTRRRRPPRRRRAPRSRAATSTPRRPRSPSSSPAARASITSGRHARADHDAVAVERQPAFETTRATRAVRALEALELVAAVHLHPVLLEHALEEAAHLAPELALERHVLLHQRSSTSRRARRSASRPPRSRCSCRRSARRARRPAAVVADRVGVPERAQVVDPVEVARRRPAAAARSRRSRSAPCSNATSSLVDSFATRSPGSSFITLVRGQQLDVRAPPTTRRAGTARPRATRRPRR